MDVEAMMNHSMRGIRRLATLGVVVLGNMLFMVSDAMADGCDALVERVQSDQRLTTPASQAATLEKSAAQCVGRAAYDINLALIYLEAGQNDAAARAASRGLAAGSKYQPNLKQVLAEVILRKGDAEAAYREGQRVAEEYPLYVPVLGFLAEIDARAKRWQQGLDLMSRAYRLQPSAVTLLAMAAAFHQLDRHEECVNAVYQALKLEPSRIAKPGGVLEAIYSLGVLKRNAEAAELLKRHMAANPKWASNPSMLSAARALSLSK